MSYGKERFEVGSNMWLGRDKSSRAEHQNLKWVRQIKYSAFIFEVTPAHKTLRTTGLIKLKE